MVLWRPHRHHDLNQAEDIEGRIKRNPIIGTLIVSAIVISSVLTIAGAVGGSINWLRQRTEWRAIEYRKLTALRAGYSIEKFKEQLGSPLFVQAMKKAKYTENTFRGRDYWVSAISKSDGTVVQYAVTACDRKFQPTFGFAKGSSIESSVTLNATTMSAMDHLLPLSAEYVMPGNTANNYMFDIFYGASPGNYKTYAWGINDTCQDFWADERRRALAAATSFYTGPTSNASPLMHEARNHIVVNTYVETAPAAQLVHGDNGQIGVDRITVG